MLIKASLVAALACTFLSITSSIDAVTIKEVGGEAFVEDNASLSASNSLGHAINHLMQTPVSYDDIAERRFSPLASAPSNTLSPFEGDGDPATFLFADPPEKHFAPIVDLTHPRTFSSLNTLIHRWKHLHIYRTQPDGSVNSLTFLMRRPPNAGYELARGWKVVGLNERIHTIEYIKRRYGASVAWARFHRLFTPVDQVDLSSKGKAEPTFNDVAQADFYWQPFDNDEGKAARIRDYLDRTRMGRFASLDGGSMLGVKIDPQGVASHYEELFDKAH